MSCHENVKIYYNHAEVKERQKNVSYVKEEWATLCCACYEGASWHHKCRHRQSCFDVPTALNPTCNIVTIYITYFRYTSQNAAPEAMSIFF